MMTDPVTYCATPKCFTRGAHLDACTGYNDHGTECTGCTPRIAEHGTLCGWCLGRLEADVTAAPALVAHLIESGRPFAQASPPRETFAPGDPAEGTVRPAQWDAADELHAMLASWAKCLIEEYPARLGGPNEHGTTRTTPTVHTVDPAAVRPEDEGYAYVRPSQVAGITEPEATMRLCVWLLPHLPWIAGQGWAAEMRREVGEHMATTRARWPMVDTRTEHVKGVSCVRCGRLSITRTPPNFPGASMRIECSHPDCGRIYTEAELDGALGRLLVERGYVA